MNSHTDPAEGTAPRRSSDPTQDSNEPPPREADRPRRSPAFSGDLQRRFGARVLDTASALRRPGQPEPYPTVYVGDALLVRGDPQLAEQTRRELVAFAKGKDIEVRQTDAADTCRAQVRTLRVSADSREKLVAGCSERLRLAPAGRGASKPVDAWNLLQEFRSHLGDRSELLPSIGLEHLLVATPFTDWGGITGAPFTDWGSATVNPFTDWGGAQGALTGYGEPGMGGRQPVSWLGRPPVCRVPHLRDANGADHHDPDAPRPLVAVLDTGVGEHPWLDASHVVRDPTFAGQPLGVPASGADSSGSSNAFLGLLDAEAGHGTFISGLVRQACPDALILAVRVYGGVGVVPEGDLARSIQLLAQRQAAAVHGVQENGRPIQPVDVVNLSLGYYHEEPEDAQYDQVLLPSLKLLGELGATVVVSAGNDATDRPMFPAAFAPWTRGVQPSHDALPLISVAAANPNGSTALFSNGGEWVSTVRHGAAVVSTLPVTFNGADQPAVSLADPDGHSRAALDPDDFSGGFAVWSGTSFAAPVLGGQLAAHLDTAIAAHTAGSAVDHGWSAITALVKMARP